ncbi:hypothetical protein F5B19DRAFT_438723 [Rostrohypoxylon terebratum]|nr:hypothetical protein F5B19DRAFT_438723 [Rostrohypoxylon terebratum]
MASFSSWFSRSAPNSSPIRPTFSSSNNGSLRDRILGGRVTKPLTPKKNTHQESTGSPGWRSYLGMAAQASRPVTAEKADDIIKQEDISDHEMGTAVAERLETPDSTAESYDNVLAFSSIEDKSPPQTPENPLYQRSKPAKEAAFEQAADGDDDMVPSDSEVSSTTPEATKNYGSEDGWRYEQVFLNQILRARDEYSLMPSTWKMHFRGVPLPEGLFYIKTNAVATRPRIYALSDRLEYRGARALRRLMDIHGQIRDMRKAKTDATQDDNERRIVKHIKERVQTALRWAELDADIARFSDTLPPNVRLIEMYEANKHNMHIPIQKSMAEVATAWRERLERVPSDQRPVSPVIFGLVIFKHILFIVTLDSQDPEATCHIPIQVNLLEKNQNQWNALAIMVTICWARDLYADVVNKIPDLLFDAPKVESDPDV